ARAGVYARRDFLSLARRSRAARPAGLTARILHRLAARTCDRARLRDRALPRAVRARAFDVRHRHLRRERRDAVFGIIRAAAHRPTRPDRRPQNTRVKPMRAAGQRRALFWAPAVAALLLVLLLLFRPQPVPVDLGVVERGLIQVTVSDEGETRVRDVFVISASVTGLMRRVELEAGDRVVANETIIARLEPSVPMFLDDRAAAEASATVDAADAARSFAVAQLRRAEAERDFADSELKRLQALASHQSISRNDLDAAERRARTAHAAVAEARAALKMRESELERARARLLKPAQAKRAARDCECVLVRSPISGPVLRVLQESEAIVNAGTPILVIGAPSNLEIKVELLSEDAVRVKPGQRVLIDGWGGDRSLEGVVERVEPFGFTKVSALGIEEQRVNAIIDITSPHEQWQSLDRKSVA